MKTLLLFLVVVCTLGEFIRFPFPGLPTKDVESKSEYRVFRKKQQIYLLINMLRVDPQGFVEKFMKPLFADDTWKLLFKTESVRLKKFPDYYPLYQDALLEQTATHARLGESFASTRSRLKDKLPPKLDGFVPGYKPLRLLAQTLVWRARTQNDFFAYLCHGSYQTVENCGRKQLVLAGCKPDYIDRKTPRGRIRLLLRQTGAVGCNNVNTLIPNENMFACDVTYPDFTPRLRVKSPLVAGNWFYSGVGTTRVYAVVVHIPHREKVHKAELIIDGKKIDMKLAFENGVSQVYYVTYTPMKHIPSNMKGYFFHVEINDKHFFYPAQFYYDWEQHIKLDMRQRYDGNCKVPFPDRTCDVCENGYRNVNGSCTKCTMENCDQCSEEVCLKCSKGFMLESGNCETKCIEHCDACSSTTTCDVCAPTHFLQDGNCTKCSSKFVDCATCTADKCLTYICQHQDPDCDKKYTPGLYYSKITDKCEKCSEGCKHCEPNNKTGSICELCNDGLFLTNKGECIPCHYVEGCVSGQCDGNKCLKCKKGYYRKDKGCARCEESCAICGDDGKCISCVEGYYLDEEFGKCLQYFEPENCDVKDAKGFCIKCKAGFGFNRFHKCVPCDASCKKCGKNVDECEVCKDTFFLQNGKCVPCSTKGCDMCDDKQCFSCVPNAYLHNGVCIRGPAGCSLCHNSAPICRVCEKGMKMVNGNCVPDCDIRNCAKCNGDETCRYCKSTMNPFAGYEPAPNGTNPCPFVCDPAALNCVVTDKMKRGEVDVCFSLGCKYCPPHTFRRNFKCEQCGEGCSNCLNEKECLKCLPGYVYYKGQCYKKQCDGVCGEGEFMANCTCNDCKTKFKHCAACNGEECVVCDDRFYLADNRTACLPCTKSKCPLKKCIGDDCEPPKDPECPPCPDGECEEEKCTEGVDCPSDCKEGPDCPTPTKCIEGVNCPGDECPSNRSRIGDEYVFDPNCLEHDKECYCTKCKCDYRLNKDHKCEEVPDEQKKGKCCEVEDGCCLECKAGFKRENCTCVPREDPCECGETRDAQGNCPPKAYIEYCKIVNCKKECEVCIDGYFVVNKTKCEPCKEGCKKCDEEKCIECPEGQHLNKTTGHCENCTLGCTGKCDETGEVCESCKEGEYLNETTGKCESCENCNTCIVNNGTVYCTECIDGSVPLDGICSKQVTFSRSGSKGVVVLALFLLVALIF